MMALSDSGMKRRIGIVGYGHLGQYLVDAILKRDDLELAFVWNRSPDALLGKVDSKYILDDLSDFVERNADLVVEVAHPNISREYGELFIKHADYLVGSPTAFAEWELEKKLRGNAVHHGIYIPTGAFWGGEDIKKMADRGTLQALKVTMTKDAASIKWLGDPGLLEQGESCRTVLYSGGVRGLCSIAPNNVNTMAAAALAAHNLGFDGVQGCLVADPGLGEWHTVDVETWGPGDIAAGDAFHVSTRRRNPAKIGVVTGTATYASFLSSMLVAHGKGDGIHLC